MKPKTPPVLNRRRAIQTTLASPALLSMLPGLPALISSAAKQPNLLLLMSDQHRGDCMGAAGHPVMRTPHLDRIAQEGVRFSCAYSSTPTCTPARSALLTGLSPWRHGMLGYGRVAEKYELEKPAALAQGGYYTFCVGKNHFHPQRQPHGYQGMLLDESGRAISPDFRSDYRSWFTCMAPTLDPDATGIGFNDYRSKPYVLPEFIHPTHWTGECAVRFLETYSQPQPFFLKVSFARPHSPYDPPQRFFDMYKDEEIPRAAVGAWAARYADGDPSNYNSWFGDMGEAQVRQSRQGYYGSVTQVDEQIGRILEALEKRHMLENTLILYLSDHGDMTGDQNLWRKSYAYEPSAHIPMLLRLPGELYDAPHGRVCSLPVEIRDILPTLLDAASLPGAEQLDGKSLISPAQGHEDGWREWIDLEHDICYHPSNHWSALTDGRMKYIYHARDGEEQLFNLEDDPHEINDLASLPEHQEALLLWRNRLIEHLSERGERFVVSGRLALRPDSYLYSPHYPNAQSSATSAKKS